MENYSLKQYAHIGDAVWELFIREYVINLYKTQKSIHENTVKYVRAEFQSSLTEKLPLNENEIEIIKRGRNLPLTINKRNNQNIHRQASAFEVLIGYLYMNNKERLNELFEIVKKTAL